MILSDRDILRRLESGDLTIEPLADPDIQIQPASVDLRLGREFLEFQRTNIPYIHPDSADEVHEYVSETVVDPDSEFILHPGDFVLGTTKERVEIPPDLIAHVEGRSSLGRLAIVVHASLPADEELFLWTPTDGFGFHQIGDIVEQRRNARVVGFDPQTLQVSTHPITNYITNPATRIYRVTLASGRQVRVTADHNLFTLDPAGGVTRIPSEDAPGRLVMVPDQLPRPRGVRRTLDVGTLIGDAPDIHSVAADGAGQAAMPNATETFVAEGARLPHELELTPTFGWVLGRYLVDGTTRDGTVRFANGADTDRLRTWFDRPGVTLVTDGDALSVRSRLWAQLFAALADGPGVPDVIWDWPDAILTGLLAGAADRAPDASLADATIQAPTAVLADRLFYCAGRLGIDASLDPADDRTLQLHADDTIPDRLPAPGALLRSLREAIDASRADIAAAIGGLAPAQLQRLETDPDATVARTTLAAVRAQYAAAGAETARLDQLVDGDVRFEQVTDVVPTDRVERTYDLEVQPNGRLIENFLGGRGGVFLSNTAGLCDPGYQGQITLELSNLGAAPVALSPGMRISQLTFTELSSPADRPYGTDRGSKYQDQSGPQASRIGNDPEFDEDD